MATNAPIPTPATPLAPPPMTTNSLADMPIRDLKPPVEIPDWSWLWWVLGAVLLGAAVAWWLRRPRKSEAVIEVTPGQLIPPHVRAKARLEEALRLIGEPKPFTFAVSDALRLYLEEQFDLRAPERTTEEFLDEVQVSPLLDETQKTLLGDFLTRCDLVKFAKHEPKEPELRDLHAAALRLVIETEMTRSAQAAVEEAPDEPAPVESAKPVEPA